MSTNREGGSGRSLESGVEGCCVEEGYDAIASVVLVPNSMQLVSGLPFLAVQLPSATFWTAITTIDDHLGCSTSWS